MLRIENVLSVLGENHENIHRFAVHFDAGVPIVWE